MQWMGAADAAYIFVLMLLVLKVVSLLLSQ